MAFDYLRNIYKMRDFTCAVKSTKQKGETVLLLIVKAKPTMTLHIEWASLLASRDCGACLTPLFLYVGVVASPWGEHIISSIVPQTQ